MSIHNRSEKLFFEPNWKIAERADPPLRIGLMLDSKKVFRWVHDIITGVQEAGFTELVLVVINGKSHTRRRAERINRSCLIYDCYEKLDRKLFREDSDPFDLVDISDKNLNVPELVVTPEQRDQTLRLLEEDIVSIGSHKLDVILQFGFSNLCESSLTMAKYGVWSYRFSGNESEPSCFWEIYGNFLVTQSILLILSDKPSVAKPIYRSFSATKPTSLHRNRIEHYRKTQTFMLRRLRDLHERGWDHIETSATHNEEGQYNPKPYRDPDNLLMLRYLARIAWRVMKNRFDRRWRPQWFIGIRARNGHSALHKPLPDTYTYLRPPRGRFYADPFPFEFAGRSYVFFEDFSYAASKAHISYTELGKGGAIGKVRSALERPYHLSYPFLFVWQDRIYMLPESVANRTVELYRAVEFPHRWELDRIFFQDVRAVDATIVEHDKRFWLFCAMSVSGGGLSDELFIFHADSPLGPWIPHRSNPVVSDIARARPAGTLFRHGGALIRPAQDCSHTYGWGYTLNRVDVLTPTDYLETPLKKITPGWYPGAIGTHTLSYSPSFEVLDLKVRSRR